MVHDDGFEPDIILAIARGGLLMAGALGYALSVKNLYTMNVEYYTGIDERLDVPMILPPTPTSSTSPRPTCSSPTTSPTPATRSPLVKEFCVGKVGEVRSRGALREAALGREVRVRVEETDLWIEFPWSDPGADRLTGPDRFSWCKLHRPQ